MTLTWATCLVVVAAVASAVAVFPSTPKSFRSYSASQAVSVEVALAVAAASLEAVSLKASPVVPVAVEHVVSRVALVASKASTSVDKRPRTTRALAHQPTPPTMVTISKQNRDEGRQVVEVNRKTMANTVRARENSGGVLRRRRLPLRVTRSCSSSAELAWSF